MQGKNRNSNPLKKPYEISVNQRSPLELFGLSNSLFRVILFAVTEFLGTGSQVPLLLVIDAI
jgi:hypothetical protein